MSLRERVLSYVNRRRSPEECFLQPHVDIEKDYNDIYEKNNIFIGDHRLAWNFFQKAIREHTVAVVGGQLGDEGKGRIVDNKLAALLNIPGVTHAYVVRTQGGSNAGHTVENDDAKLALHQVPSGVFYDKAVGIMDRGMVIHAEDLKTEIEYVEAVVGDTRGKLILSEDATLVTDYDRALEVLYRSLYENSKGGTGRGIRIAYSERLNQQRLSIKDLMDENWEEKLSTKYELARKLFEDLDPEGRELHEMHVPDFAQTKINQAKGIKKAAVRTVGTKEEFLDRLRETRNWMLHRQNSTKYEDRFVQDTYLLHHDIYTDLKIGVMFEMAQAVGLDTWLGTYPDVTSSSTGVDGIKFGTAGAWIPDRIKEKIGVIKATYMSSVGKRTMPTEIPLDPSVLEEDQIPLELSNDQSFGYFARFLAREFGTTTGRPRDICFLDLPFLMYNCRVGGIEALAATHLDIAKKGQKIKICTHYVDMQGNIVPYKPDLEYLHNVIPVYFEVDGWDPEDVQKAKSFSELPENAQKYLAFIQRRTGIPIVIATTGPKRDQYIEMERPSIFKRIANAIFSLN